MGEIKGVATGGAVSEFRADDWFAPEGSEGDAGAGGERDPDFTTDTCSRHGTNLSVRTTSSTIG